MIYDDSKLFKIYLSPKHRVHYSCYADACILRNLTSEDTFLLKIERLIGLHTAKSQNGKDIVWHHYNNDRESLFKESEFWFDMKMIWHRPEPFMYIYIPVCFTLNPFLLGGSFQFVSH